MTWPFDFRTAYLYPALANSGAPSLLQSWSRPLWRLSLISSRHRGGQRSIDMAPHRLLLPPKSSLRYWQRVASPFAYAGAKGQTTWPRNVLFCTLNACFVTGNAVAMCCLCCRTVTLRRAACNGPAPAASQPGQRTLLHAPSHAWVAELFTRPLLERRPRCCCRRAALQTTPCRGGVAALASLRAIAVRATLCRVRSLGPPACVACDAYVAVAASLRRHVSSWRA